MADKAELLTAFGDHLNAIPDEQSNQSHWLFGYALEWLAQKADDLYHALGTEAEVEAFVRESYRTYAEPIDIPLIPNGVIEAVVDKAIEDALVAGVKAAHSALHKE